jgi:hypothetical protein
MSLGRGSGGAAEAAEAAGSRKRGGSLPPELTVEGWADEQAAKAAKAREVKEETMDALPPSLVISDDPVLDGARSSCLFCH